MRFLASVLCVLTISCSSFAGPGSTPDYPDDRLNPAGSPWGPPPDPEAEPEMVATVWGVALVVTRGYPGVSVHTIEDVLYEAAKVCEPSRRQPHHTEAHPNADAAEIRPNSARASTRLAAAGDGWTRTRTCSALIQ